MTSKKLPKKKDIGTSIPSGKIVEIEPPEDFGVAKEIIKTPLKK